MTSAHLPRARGGTLPLTALILVVVALVPVLQIDERMLGALTLGLIYAIAVVGLDIFSGYSGQMSFGNFAFVAIGAYTTAILTTDHGWSLWAALPAAIAVTSLCGLLLGIPMVKLPGLGSALVTFFFSFLVVVLLGGETLQKLTHGLNGIAAPSLYMFGLDFSYGPPLYYLSFVVLLIVTLTSYRYANSRAGRAMRVVKRGDILAESMGISAQGAKLSAFVFSTAAAGVAGWLFAQALGFLSPETFPASQSVVLVAMLIVGGMGTIGGPILGAIFFEVLAEVTRAAGATREIVFAAALLIGLIYFPRGIFGIVDDTVGALLRKLPWHRKRRTPSAELRRIDQAHHATDDSTDAGADRPPMLTVDGVGVGFGGLKALQDVALTVERGEVYAILGPNGAGKTTLLNCISGIQQHSGTITFDGTVISGLPPAQIKRLGISRTFQHPALVPDLTVEENVALGAYSQEPRLPYLDLLPTPGTFRRDRWARAEAKYALDLVQFPEDRRTAAAADLTLAEQKIVDIARAVAGEARLLLLDEPTAGLSEEDTERVVQVILALRAQSGMSIVVIAHHVGFLRAIATRSTVLNFGRVLAVGDIADITRRDDVAEVFLGVSHVE